MLKEYPKLEKGKIEEFYNGLKAEERTFIEDYLTYRKARGLKDISMLSNTRRMILQCLYLLDKPINSLTLKELREMISIINNSKLSESYKNNIKANFKNFIRYSVPDWSMKFSNLEDIRTNGIGEFNQERINEKTIIKKEEVEELLKAEFNPKWKTFLLIQYEGGLRTGEVRNLKWSDLKIDIEDGLTEVSIFAGKTKKARTVYVREATKYLKLLQKEQENTKTKGIYIFTQRWDINLPIAKYSVNEWFRKLTKKVLGEERWNYLLRHSRATELYKLARENKISKDTAIKFMGHSQDMSKVYDHTSSADVKKMLKDQIYHIEELTPEEKSELKDIGIAMEKQKEMNKMLLHKLQEMEIILSKINNQNRI